MFSGVELTAYAHRAILGQLVDIEERKDEIINELYCEPSPLRDEFSFFMDNYVKSLEELVGASQIVEKPSREKLKLLNYLPYVIIGSAVEIENAADLSTHLFKIVTPYDASNSKHELSYLSALGKSLLLKKKGDVIKAELDKGICTFKIRSIRYEP